jgi:lipopolysaccharide transport system permease protein
MGPAVEARAVTAPRRLTPLMRPPDRIYDVEVVIRPTAAPLAAQLRELWLYRHLFMALVWRNVRVEFDATRLGSVWAFARPLMFAIVFSLFRNFSGANTHVELPYMVFVYSGLLLWTYFTDAATNAAGATRLDLTLLTKVYYPRLITPCVPVVAGLLTIAIGMVPLIGMMIWFEVHPGWQIVLLPAAILPCIMLALGLGMLVSAISLENRDWERVLGYGLTVGLWLSPVIYAPDMIPHAIRDWYHLNPVAGPLLAFRAALFDGVPFPLWEWTYSLIVSFAILLLGTWAFRRTEVRLADCL